MDGEGKILHKDNGKFHYNSKKTYNSYMKKMYPQRMPFTQEGATVEEKAFHYKWPYGSIR